MALITLQDNCLRLSVYVQPKASRDQIVGQHGDAIKIAITAPPVEGQANKHIVKYLAKLCKVAKSQVRVVKGEQSRHKQIEISDPKQLPDIFQALLAEA